MGTVYSQGTWRQSELQVHTRKSKAAWAAEVFLLPRQRNTGKA